MEKYLIGNPPKNASRRIFQIRTLLNKPIA